MVISAINALSLSPAALLADPAANRKKAQGRPSPGCRTASTKGRSGYVPGGGRPSRRRGFHRPAAGGGLRRGHRRARRPWCPRASCPTRTRGAFMAEVQLSRRRLDQPQRSPAIDEVEAAIEGKPWLKSIFTVFGLQPARRPQSSQPRTGRGPPWKPFDQRQGFQTLGLPCVGGDERGLHPRSPRPMSSPSTCRRSWGWAIRRAFEFRRSVAGRCAADRARRRRPAASWWRPSRCRSSTSVFTTYGASTAADQPQGLIASGRRRWASNIADIFSALQTRDGAAPTPTDFNLFRAGTWQVKVQAEAGRPPPPSTTSIACRVRSSSGELVPLQAVADVELITAPRLDHPLQNNLRSVTLNGRGPAAGFSSGDAIAAIGAACQGPPCPAGYGLRMDRHGAGRKKRRAARPASSWGLALVFAYLFLVGLYESTAIPIAALLLGHGRPVRAPWPRL